MIHKPIQLKNLSLFFPHKICFEDFSADIHYSSRIAIIGRNGCGKSTLLKILLEKAESSAGCVLLPEDLRVGYVPQVIEDYQEHSGGERFNKVLTQALSHEPNVLLLDEPTNHLDQQNRRSLMTLLRNYLGTLIIVSHDVELLRHSVDEFWLIEDSVVKVFKGNYDDMTREKAIRRQAIEQELIDLKRQKKEMHSALMSEQRRAAKSRVKGQKSISQRKWPTIVSNAKACRSQETTGRKKAEIKEKKQKLLDSLSELQLPEVIKPSFSLLASDLERKTVLSIDEGEISYSENKTVLSQINISLMAGDRLAVLGNNGSGKTTLLRALMDDPSVIKSGSWYLPRDSEIGYLDQHYETVCPHLTVLEALEQFVPDWQPMSLRRHLCDFLFRKNEEVNALVSSLSGGEKARLSLSQIAAKTPKLLILDEITNNLDLDTREHVIQVLREYPGSLIVVSHDEDFLKAIEINDYYKISSEN